MENHSNNHVLFIIALPNILGTGGQQALHLFWDGALKSFSQTVINRASLTPLQETSQMGTVGWNGTLVMVWF